MIMRLKGICLTVFAIIFISLILMSNGLQAMLVGSSYSNSNILADYDPTDMTAYTTVGEYYPPQDGIDTLNINWQGGRVQIIAYNEEDYYFEELSTRLLYENERLSYSIDDNVLSIDFNSTYESPVNDAYKSVEVRVPKSIANKLKSVNVTNTGAVVMRNIRAETITINGDSGNVDCSWVYSKNMTVTTDEGNVSLAVPSDVGFKLAVDTKKGKFKYPTSLSEDNGVLSCGDGEFVYSVKTASGDVCLENVPAEQD